jgi:hypothetical protein
MTVSTTQILFLEDFLKLPYLEDSPAWEYLDGVAVQKPKVIKDVAFALA